MTSYPNFSPRNWGQYNYGASAPTNPNTFSSPYKNNNPGPILTSGVYATMQGGVAVGYSGAFVNGGNSFNATIDPAIQLNPGFWDILRYRLRGPKVMRNPPQFPSGIDATPITGGYFHVAVNDLGLTYIEDLKKALPRHKVVIPSCDLFNLISYVVDPVAFPVDLPLSSSERIEFKRWIQEAWHFLGVVDKAGNITLLGNSVINASLGLAMQVTYAEQDHLDKVLQPTVHQQVAKWVKPNEWAVLLTNMRPGPRTYWGNLAKRTI